jgi:hypothetical protein
VPFGRKKRKSKSSPTPAIWRAKESLNSERRAGERRKDKASISGASKSSRQPSPTKTNTYPDSRYPNLYSQFPMSTSHIQFTRARDTKLLPTAQFNSINPIQFDRSNSIQSSPVQFSPIAARRPDHTYVVLHIHNIRDHLH